MRPIILVPKWPDHEGIYGSDREELVWLLKRSCQGAVRVHVNEETEIIHGVRRVTASLEQWQRSGGSL
jgi:hypothetical protein